MLPGVGFAHRSFGGQTAHRDPSLGMFGLLEGAQPLRASLPEASDTVALQELLEFQPFNLLQLLSPQPACLLSQFLSRCQLVAAVKTWWMGMRRRKVTTLVVSAQYIFAFARGAVYACDMRYAAAELFLPLCLPRHCWSCSLCPQIYLEYEGHTHSPPPPRRASFPL